MHSSPDNSWAWSGTGLAWADNQQVQVKLEWERPHGPRPGKPTLTLVTSGTNAPTATTLSFTIPCVSPGKAQVTDYVLFAEKAGSSALTQVFSVPSPCRTITVTLTGLTAATQYRVRAFARNLYARVSELSDYVQGTTLTLSVQGDGNCAGCGSADPPIGVRNPQDLGQPPDEESPDQVPPPVGDEQESTTEEDPPDTPPSESTPETEAEPSDIVSQYDANGDGVINQSEWESAIDDYTAGLLTNEQIYAISKAREGAGKRVVPAFALGPTWR